MKKSFPIAVAIILILVPSPAGASQLIDNLKAGKDQVVVAYGTSLTEKGAWVAQVGQWLNSQGFPGKATMINKGVSGSTTRTHGVPDVDRDVIQQKADAVFVEFAMNDCIRRLADPNATPPRLVDAPVDVSLEKFKSNLEKILDDIHAGLPNAEVLLLTMNVASDSAHYPNSGKYRAALPDYYQAIRDIGAAKSVCVIDIYPEWLALQKSDPERLKALIIDGVHPTPEGNGAIITPTIQSALTR
ncbi:MAG: GDSL-type esterase/lipase family protein [Verrucomicrobiota bacterium]